MKFIVILPYGSKIVEADDVYDVVNGCLTSNEIFNCVSITRIPEEYL